jgi:hypothetical protein
VSASTATVDNDSHGPWHGAVVGSACKVRPADGVAARQSETVLLVWQSQQMPHWLEPLYQDTWPHDTCTFCRWQASLQQRLHRGDWIVPHVQPDHIVNVGHQPRQSEADQTSALLYGNQRCQLRAVSQLLSIRSFIAKSR